MSTQSPFRRRGQVFPTLPKGDVLGTYDSYLDAQTVVDKLAKAEFPVKQVSIVGSDLKVDGYTWNQVDPLRVRRFMEAARR